MSFFYDKCYVIYVRWIEEKIQKNLDTVEVNDRFSQRHPLIIKLSVRLKLKCYGKSIFEGHCHSTYFTP